MAFLKEFETVFNGFMGVLNEVLYSKLLIFLLIAAGLYFTVRTGFVQLRSMADVMKILRERGVEKDGKRQIS